MRHFVGLFGLVCSVIVIAVAARYGFKTSDNDFDGYIWAFIYGAITSGGLGGHMVGVRLWRYEKHVLSLIVFAASVLFLLISLSNSLGAMAGRMNTTQATRIQTADIVRDARRDLKRAQDERDSLKFEPTDVPAVEAARNRAKAATGSKDAECNGYRGPRCRDKEEAEKQALADLTATSKSKAATERAHELDGEIKALKEKIEKAGPVLDANSQGNALARLFALPEGDAARLSTYQNLAMAIGIEILIVLSLIAYEVMSEHERERLPKPASAPVPEVSRLIESEAVAIAEDADEEPVEPLNRPSIMTALPVIEDGPKAFPAPPRPRLIASRPDPVGNVVEIMAEILEPGRGKVKFTDVFAAYAATCEAHGKRPISVDEFPAALADLCKRLGIEIEATDKGVYLLMVRLRKAAKAS